MSNNVHNNHGFTLIELLVTILILGVLSAAVLIVINPQQRIAQANDATRKADLKQIATALEAYKVKTGSYPAPCTQYGDGSCNSYNNGPNWIPELIERGFLKSLPQDPKNSGFVSVYGEHHSYFYISETAYGGTAGDYFILGAWLENKQDLFTLTNFATRPKWPGCGGNDIGFSDNIYIIRSYTCPEDPEGAQ